MKLVQYGPAGKEKPGVIDQDGILRDISSITARITGKTLTPAVLNEIRNTDLKRQPQVLGSPRLGPCVSQLKKFICIGLSNNVRQADKPYITPIEPVVFNPYSNAEAGIDCPLLLTRSFTETWETDLAVVIGRAGRYIAEQFALEHIAGYCTLSNTADADEPEPAWQETKIHYGHSTVGPCLVTTDELIEPQQLEVSLEFANRHQQICESMQLTVAKVISYLSYHMTLRPGDLISVGKISRIDLQGDEDTPCLPGFHLSMDNHILEMMACQEFI
ncbi:fumarylacetoacetate hydrolase family protein [Neptuniibacter halophilus]|uniref:fumarylacetoacetate hydrolase family protein n=1 Tax=Neptuniibacter halophilus TaxID=651666 RepID=UPI002572FEA0|nr:fumarylacetoacetate hydrolase family protein [Neptuniibacter halophilus]